MIFSGRSVKFWEIVTMTFVERRMLEERAPGLPEAEWAV